MVYTNDEEGGETAGGDELRGCVGGSPAAAGHGEGILEEILAVIEVQDGVAGGVVRQVES